LFAVERLFDSESAVKVYRIFAAEHDIVNYDTFGVFTPLGIFPENPWKIKTDALPIARQFAPRGSPHPFWQSGRFSTHLKTGMG